MERLEFVHQERRGQVKAIIMEHFNSILFHKSGPANKQHTNQPTNQPMGRKKFERPRRMDDMQEDIKRLKI